MTNIEERRLGRAATPLALWCYFVLLNVIVFGFLIQAILFLFTWPFDRRRQIVGRWYRITAIIAARLSMTWHFGVHGPLPAVAPRRTVCVSNHKSQADPFLISHLPWEMKWLGKAVLFRVPFIGWSMALAGDIAIRRGQRDSVADAMRVCGTWLDRGANVMIFPEGTRSPDHSLLAFKDGAFRLAIEKQADILPIAVAGTRAALPKHSWRPGVSYARVSVGTAISTVGMTLDDVPRLKEEARAQIEALYARLIPVVEALTAPH